MVSADGDGCEFDQKRKEKKTRNKMKSTSLSLSPLNWARQLAGMKKKRSKRRWSRERRRSKVLSVQRSQMWINCKLYLSTATTSCSSLYILRCNLKFATVMLLIHCISPRICLVHLNFRCKSNKEKCRPSGRARAGLNLRSQPVSPTCCSCCLV